MGGGGGVWFTDFTDYSELMCMKIQHSSVSSVQDRDGRQQLPAMQIQLLCYNDLVGVPGQVNAAYFGFVISNLM